MLIGVCGAPIAATSKFKFPANKGIRSIVTRDHHVTAITAAAVQPHHPNEAPPKKHTAQHYVPSLSDPTRLDSQESKLLGAPFDY
jgi:hypothetical protein